MNMFWKRKRSFAERRKIIESIPIGVYCYTITSHNEDGSLGIKCCPYWKHIGKYRAKCKLLGIKDRYEQDSGTLLWDQCKICNLKYGFK